MENTRSSGILLHPTSLPGSYGIGDLGPEAYDFAKGLRTMGQSLWQVLPLYPTGYGDSPYAAFSAFAGNPLLISPEILYREGWLTASMLRHKPRFSKEIVEFERVKPYKEKLFREAFRSFIKGGGSDRKAEFEAFCRSQHAWLKDFTLFMALKQQYKLRPWWQWPEDLRMHRRDALAGAGKRLEKEITYQSFLQWVFFSQWNALRKTFNDAGIRIIGDNPIYEAYDSADVWAHPGLFLLDKEHRPVEVAGVPPDCFSPTGQLWGNPLYDWPAHKARDYRWWKENLAASFAMTDLVRIDHFIGFVRYYAIPFGETTAENGRWRKGPGAAFFRSLQKHFGTLPLIAEDLGAVTPEVLRIRKAMGFPGMKILQEAFDGNPDHHFLPKYCSRDFVVYTATHDTDTTMSVLSHMRPAQIKQLKQVLHIRSKDPREWMWGLIRAALETESAMAIFPMQDILGLGREARMNLPGTVGGNWQWRMRKEQLDEQTVSRMAALTKAAGRK